MSVKDMGFKFHAIGTDGGDEDSLRYESEDDIQDEAEMSN